MSNTEKVYGIHATGALLRHHPESIYRLYVLKSRDDQRLNELVSIANSLNIPLEQCTREELDHKASTSSNDKHSRSSSNHSVHQGIIAECHHLRLEKDEAFLTSMLKDLDHPPLLLILDGITDPHNLGACLRSAEAAGADAVIVPKDKSAQISTVVRKVACGAAEIVPFIVVTNLARCLQNLQKQGVWIMGTAGEAEQSLYQADLKGPLALVLGSEGKGMRRLTREHCDTLLHIPMAGEVSSLNVSVSAGVCLFEAVRQRKVSA